MDSICYMSHHIQEAIPVLHSFQIRMTMIQNCRHARAVWVWIIVIYDPLLTGLTQIISDARHG